MGKKIDIFVFGVGIVTLIIELGLLLAAINTGDRELITIGSFINFGCSFFIFAHFMQDKNFKFKYFIGYAFSNIVVNTLLTTTSNFLKFKSMIAFVLAMILLGLIGAFISAYLYQIFKLMSYNNQNKL